MAQIDREADKRHPPVPLIETENAARLMGFHPNTLVKMRMRGDGPPFVRVGRGIRYRQRDLERFIEQHKFRNTSQYGPEIGV